MAIDVGLREGLNERIINALSEQGKSMQWLCEKLNLPLTELEEKLAHNEWKVGEIIKLSNLLNLNG